MAARGRYRRIASCRDGPHPELCKQPLMMSSWHLSRELGRSIIGLTETEEGQVDGPPTNEGAKSRDADEPAVGWNFISIHTIIGSHLEKSLT